MQRHGPHVEKRDDPEAAEVSLRLVVPETGKAVVLKRNVKTAKTFTSTPEDPKVRAVLEEVAQHPELTLSRREIIKYILVEAGERSKEIQALLKLDDVGKHPQRAADGEEQAVHGAYWPRIRISATPRMRCAVISTSRSSRTRTSSRPSTRSESCSAFADSGIHL